MKLNSFSGESHTPMITHNQWSAFQQEYKVQTNDHTQPRNLECSKKAHIGNKTLKELQIGKKNL